MEEEKLVTEVDKLLAEAKEAGTQMMRWEAFVNRLRTGKLTYREYKSMGANYRRAYTKQFGRPKTDDELRRKQNTKAASVQKKKAAKASRKRNRR